MNKQKKQKRDKLVVLTIATLVAASGLWLGIIQPDLVNTKLTENAVKEFADKVEVAQRHVQRAKSYKADMEAVQARLERVESRMATGDVYRWLIRVFPSSQRSNNVEITAVEPPQIGDWPVLPRLPYKAAVFTVTGIGYYEQIGTFIAHIENAYPHMRLRSLELEPSHIGVVASEADEKVAFKMELATLIKPAPGIPRPERK